jgi:hypothetical protein
MAIVAATPFARSSKCRGLRVQTSHALDPTQPLVPLCLEASLTRATALSLQPAACGTDRDYGALLKPFFFSDSNARGPFAGRIASGGVGRRRPCGFPYAAALLVVLVFVCVCDRARMQGFVTSGASLPPALAPLSLSRARALARYVRARAPAVASLSIVCRAMCLQVRAHTGSHFLSIMLAGRPGRIKRGRTSRGTQCYLPKRAREARLFAFHSRRVPTVKNGS